MGIDWEDMYGYDDYDSADYGDVYDEDVVEFEATSRKKSYGYHNRTRYYVYCPYHQKEKAKALGGRWDPDRKSWYFYSEDKVAQLKRWL